MPYYVIIDRGDGLVQWIGKAEDVATALQQFAAEVGGTDFDPAGLDAYEVSAADAEVLGALCDRYGPAVAARAVLPDGRVDPAQI